MSRGRELVDGVAGSRPGSRAPESTGLGHRGLGGEGLNPARLGRWVEERLDWLLDDDSEDDWREPWQEAARGRDRGAFRQDGALGQPGVHGLEPPQERWSEVRRSSMSTSQRLARSEASPLRATASEAIPARRSLEAVSRRPARADAAGAAAARQGIEAGTGASRPSDPAARGLGRVPLNAAGAPTAAEEAWPDDDDFTLPRWQRPSRPAGSSLQPPEPPVSPTGPASRPLPRSSRRR